MRALSKMRLAVKAVIDENQTKVKLNNTFSIKQDYYGFLKKDSQNHYISETNTMYKVFQDLYFESYYDKH